MNNILKMYFLVRAQLLIDLTINKELQKYVRLSPDALHEAAVKVSAMSKTEYVLDPPKYMFTDKPVTPTTWIELQAMQLDTYPLTSTTALLVEPVTREYCYVYWDEAGQCSNPYTNLQDALNGLAAYMKQL